MRVNTDLIRFVFFFIATALLVWALLVVTGLAAPYIYTLR